MKKALITGVTGQDGSYLAEFLLGKGYDVHGIIRRSSVDYRERIAHLEGNPHLRPGAGGAHGAHPGPGRGDDPGLHPLERASV